MCRIWKFLASFPPREHGRRRTKYRQLEDFRRWYDLLPQTNWVCFLDDTSRRMAYMFTDACSCGIGGFIYIGNDARTPFALTMPPITLFRHPGPTSMRWRVQAILHGLRNR